MARKDLLKGLIENASPPDEPATPTSSEGRGPVDPGRPRYSGGAIGAVSQSIAHLKSRAVVDIDPDDISDGGLSDRLDEEDTDHNALVASIRDYGQQVPVLVRPHPEQEGRYQVVYGRRRVKALRSLQLPVKALVRSLDDRDLIVAQGQENSARKGLSFIEKASFARQMRDLGYERKIICDTLHVDKTVISRMLAVAEAIDPELVAKIGAAPGAGRDRWLKLAERLSTRGLSTEDAVAHVFGNSSDRRFDALFLALSPHPGRDKPEKIPASKLIALKTSDGQPLATIQTNSEKTILTISSDVAAGFDRWLVENIAEIHRGWNDSSGE